MNKYIIAKIHTGNALAEIYLEGKSEVNFPAIPIFFEGEYDNKEAFLLHGNAKEQGRLFFECGENPDGKYVVLVYEGKVYILRPVGNVIFKKAFVREDLRDKNSFVKILPVEVIRNIAISEVPAILASTGANRYYSSGSFREITDSGNIRAIQSLLGQVIDLPKDSDIFTAIECLSSVEFETLIAKALEEAGLFVPAYRGGMMAGADIFAYNKSAESISIAQMMIPPGERKSLQIKLKANGKHLPKGIDFLVARDIEESNRLLGLKWLTEALRKSPITKNWLVSSLEWLPDNFLKSTLGSL